MSRLEITLPPAGDDDYTLRNLLNGREYRCLVTATAAVDVEDGNGQLIQTVDLGTVEASTDPVTVAVADTLLSKQYEGTKVIVGYLAEDQTTVDGDLYDPNAPYYKKEYSEGVSERKVKAAMPQTVKVIVEDRTGETQRYVVEVPVTWNLRPSADYSSYDFNVTKAVYTYSAVPDLDTLQAGESADENGKTAVWKLDASLNGYEPWAKVGWNQEIVSLAGENPFDVYTYNEEAGMSESEQRAYLNEHYPTITVELQDVMDDSGNYVTKQKEVSVTWEKVSVEEYDTANESLAVRWTSEDQSGDIQGKTAPMAKWVWEASIDSFYTLTGDLATTKPKAVFAWSRVINKINSAVDASGKSVTALKITDGNALNGSIPTSISVEFKNPLDGADVQKILTVSNTDWLVLEGRYYDESQTYKWKTLTENAALSTVSRTAPAGVVRLRPSISGYTITSNAEPDNAGVWFQWGTIVTAVKTPEGGDFELATAGKVPYVTVKPDTSSRTWASVQTLAAWPKTMPVSLLDKTVGSDVDGSINVSWGEPANYGPTADNGDYEAFLTSWGTGVYLDEDVYKELNGRVPYVRILWNVADTENLKTEDKSSTVWFTTGANFNVMGAGGEKTTYGGTYGNGYATVYKVDSTEVTNSATGNPAVYTTNNVTFSRALMLVNQRNYVKLQFTVTNNDTVAHKISIANHADTQICTNDGAAVLLTSTGLVMQELKNGGKGSCSTGLYNHQFNLVTMDSYGVTNVDHLWAGPFGQRTSHLWDGTFTSSVQTSGTDSGIVFAWMNRELAPGATQTFSVMYGIGTTANPPVLQEDISAVISSDKKSIVVKSNVKDDAKRIDTLYYVLDYGLQTAGSERSLGTVTANGSFLPINGTIEKPANWADGEYHTIALWAMNEANAMTKLYTIPLVVEKDDDGQEILKLADAATVAFQNGAGSGYTVSGTVPATIDAHIKENITLPSNTLTATNSYRFAGWEDIRTGTIYPAGTSYQVNNATETLKAHWVASNEIMYYVDIYEQDLEGNDVLASSIMQVGTKGSTISYTPPAKTGYQVDASSVLSKANVTTDNEHLKVYYKRTQHKAAYYSNYAPGLPEVVQQATGLLYGSTLSGIPTAAKLSARENSRYFNFAGWKTGRTGGTVISSGTTVTGDIAAYANWTPVAGAAKITFDYNYVNHAQGLARSDELSLTAVYKGAGHKYGYGAKVTQIPSAPGNWKDKDGKIYSFVGWQKENGDPVVVGTEFDEYESVTVKAQWLEAYDVTCTYSGKGQITTNAPVDDSGNRLPFGAGDTAMVTWQAESGYAVKHIYIDSIPRDDLIKSGGTTFENLDANHTVFVEFGAGSTGGDVAGPDEYTITTEGVGCTFTAPDTGVARVAQGDSYTVTWTPADGYQLAGVTVNGVPMQVTDSQFVFNNVHFNQTIKVEYEPDGSGGTPDVKKGPYRIETKISNGASIMGPQTVNYNEDKTITWTVPYGFHVRQVLVNHVALDPVPDGTSYTFRNVIQNCSIEVICEKDPDSGEEEDEDSYLVKTTISNGTITRTSDVGELHKGDSYAVNWSPAEGYYVSRIKIDGEWQGETVDGEWHAKIFYNETFSNISSDHEIEVECLPVSGSGEEEPVLHKVETEIVNGGTISDLSDLPDGASAVIDWTVAPGFEVKQVLLDGKDVTDEDGKPYIPDKTYTLTNITTDHTFKVVCERIPGDSGDDPVDPSATYYQVSAAINVGRIDGLQTVKEGEPCTVTWTPPEGFHVKEVKVDGVTQTMLTGNQWTIGSVTKDTAIEVICEESKSGPAEPEETVYYVETAIISGGTIVGGGEIPMDKDAQVNWTMADGYQVKEVTLDGTALPAGQLTGDGSGYLFDHTEVTAGETYKLVVTCEPIQYYHVKTSSVNTSSMSSSRDVKLGEDYKVSWSIPEGYHVKEVRVNDEAVTLADGQTSYTFSGAEAQKDETYTIDVVCEKDAAADPGTEPENPSYEVTTSIVGGQITGPQTVTAEDTEPCVINWNADEGYHVTSVLVNSKPVALTEADGKAVTSYTFRYEEMDGDATVEVTCEADPKPETDYCVTTAMEPGGGTITDSSRVSAGSDYPVAWTAPFGYQVSKVEITVDGTVTDITDSVSGSYTFTDIASDCEIRVSCEKKPTGSSGETEGRYAYVNASISGGSISGDVRTKVKIGDSHTVSWAPDAGYYVAEVQVDGNSVEPGNSWTFDNVTEDHTVQVTCKPSRLSETYYVNVSAKNADTNGSSEIEVGTDYTVRWSAYSGYHVTEVKIDGAPITVGEEGWTGGSYTFTGAAAGETHTAEITCEKDEPAEKQKFQIMTSVENGTITEPRQVYEGESVTVQWQADFGYVVKEVIVDDSSRSTSLTSWTWDSVDADHSVKVIFGKIGEELPAEDEEYVIETSINNGGSITAPVTVKTSQEKESQTIQWNPAEGYQVAKVLVDNSERADLLNASECTFTNISGNHVVAVECERMEDPGETMHTITAAIKNGSFTAVPGEVQDGGSCTITWVGAEGFVLDTVTVDGEVIEPEDPESYTFENVTADHTIRVEYTKEGGTEEIPLQYEIRTSVAGGSITGGGTVAAGTKSRTVKWTASEGYEVVKVTVDDVIWPEDQTEKAGGSITFNNINENHRVAVECSPVGQTEETSYITLDAGIKGGQFSPNISVQKIAVGTDYTISWTAAEGYAVTSVELDGEKRDDLLDAGELTLKSVSVNHVLRVECRPEEEADDTEESYLIQTKITNGTISKPFTSDAENRDYTVSWAPDEGYEVTSVLIDGNASDQAKADGSISFNPITSNHTVDVYCQKKDLAPDQYTVDASITNGVITKTADAVDAGGTITVNWQPRDGYEIKTVTIDGVQFGAAFDGSYTFSNMAGNHTVEVVCTQITQTEPNTYKVTTKKSGGDGADVSPSLPSVTEGEETTVTWAVKPDWRITDVTLNGQSLGSDIINAGQVTFSVYADNEVIVYVQKQGSTSNAFLSVTTSIQNGWICNGGSVTKGSSYPLNWIPNDGYKVKSVEITDAGGNVIKKFDETELDIWNYTIGSVESDTQVRVVCEKLPEGGEDTRNSYLVDTQIRNGTISSAQRIVAGEDCEIAWAPADGYEVTGVTIYKGDEKVTIDQEETSYTIHNIDADWRIEVVCEAVPPETEEEVYTYRVDTGISNGTINGPFTGMKKNDSAKIVWSAADGYEVTSVLIDGEEHPELLKQTGYELPMEAEDHEVFVTCTRKTASGSEDAENQYQIQTFLYDGIGDITPWTDVNEGDDHPVKWKVSVDNHYKVAAVYVDGSLTETTEDNIYTFEKVEKQHVLEVYLEPNLVNVQVSYEGQGTVSNSATLFYGEDYSVYGTPASGWELTSVIVDGRKLQAGETIEELLPTSSVLRSAASRLFADSPEEELQNEFAFSNLQENHTVHYVFSPADEEPPYSPYEVAVNLVGGAGKADASKNVSQGADTTIGWSLDNVDPSYYVERVTVTRNSMEIDIDEAADAELAENNLVSLTDIQTDTLITVYLKSGVQPAAEEANDFSLNVALAGPGAGAPGNYTDGTMEGLPAGDATASWHIADGHHVTMVMVDGEERPDLLDKTETTVTMSREDAIKDHTVVVYVDGTVLPGLEKEAGESAPTAGDVITYRISAWNESDEAVWSNVTLSDQLPEGLDLRQDSLTLKRITGSDDDLTEETIADADIRYDADSRRISVAIGDVPKGIRYELSFDAEVTNAAVDNDLDIGNKAKAEGGTSGNPEDPVVAETEAVYPGQVKTVIPKDPVPNIVKTVENSDPTDTWTQVGDILSYTIEVWNSEPGSVWKNVQVKDRLPDWLEMFPESMKVTETVGNSHQTVTDQINPAYEEENHEITVNLGDLLNGRHYLITFDARVLPEAIGEDIGNLAEAAGSSPDMKTEVRKQSETVYPRETDKPGGAGVQPVDPKPVIIKTARNLTQSESQSSIGDQVRYEITVGNEQFGSEWKDAVVRDRIPEGLEIDTGSIILVTPEGEQKLDETVYNSDTRLLSIYLGEIDGEEQYQIIFDAVITGDVTELDIGNRAWANGRNPIRPEEQEPAPGITETTKPGEPYFDEEDGWADQGGVISDKVYPNEKDRQPLPELKVTKSSRNLMRTDGNTQFGDMIDYEVQIENNAAGSRCLNMQAVDTLPEQLELQEGKVTLVCADGTVQELDAKDVYDPETGEITVRLPEVVRAGETYWLKYRTTVVERTDDTGETPEKIVNKVTVSGEDYEGNPVFAEASDAILYPAAVKGPEQGNTSPDGNANEGHSGVRTGDSAEAGRYVLLLLLALALFGIAVRNRSRKDKGKSESL